MLCNRKYLYSYIDVTGCIIHFKLLGHHWDVHSLSTKFKNCSEKFSRCEAEPISDNNLAYR